MHAHRCRGLFAAAAWAVVSVVLIAACTAGNARPQVEGREPAQGSQEEDSSPPPGEQVVLDVDNERVSKGVVAAGGEDAVYNYAPTVMRDGERIRMWWCSQYGSAPPAGDDILYAEASSADGPFTSPSGAAAQAVLSGNPGKFDGMHTCDPSVIRMDGTYYMYYTGAAGDHEHGNAIGVATSSDGLHWTRPTTEPIVTSAYDVDRDNTYGTGQPAVVYLDGWFYLMFTDTTGDAADWNGAGQFLLRAKDPTFSAGVEALGEHGFEPVSSTDTPRTRSLVNAFSADLMWVDALDAFAIAHQTEEGTTTTFWDREFTGRPYHPVLIPSEWEEGPGLVRQPDGHAPVSLEDPCGRVPIDVIHATVIGAAGAPTDLHRFGIDLHSIPACMDTDRALAVLDGLAMPSPMRTMDLVADGKVLRVDRRSVAAELARDMLPARLPVLDRLPVSARLEPGAPAVRAPELGVGFVLDGHLWPVGSPEAVEFNDSVAEPVSRKEWESYPTGPRLGSTPES